MRRHTARSGPARLGWIGTLALAVPIAGQMNWEVASPAHHPAGRWDHAAIHDAARDRVLLFGGHSPAAILGDTWEWDGVDWTERHPPVSPPPRWGHALAYDPGRGTVVLFGGHDGAAYLGDTWEWDGATWSVRAPANAPAPRAAASLATDAVRGRLVLFGGADAGGTLLQDTWLWDGVDWARASPGTVPPPRWFAGIALDERRGVVVMSSAADPDVWEWDGADWTRRPAVPPRFSSGPLVYDRLRERCVRWSGGFWPGEVFEWDGEAWLSWIPRAQPMRRDSQALAWDERSGRVLMFGGWHFHSASIYADTWRWTPATRGAAVTVGAGCAGAAGTPELAALGAPIVADRHFALRVSHARPGAFAVVVLSAHGASTPLPGGCTLRVAPPWIDLPGLVDPTGALVTPAPIPLDVDLSAATVHAQAFVQDAAGSFLGLASMTAELRLTIGD